MMADIRGNLYSFGCPEYGQLGRCCLNIFQSYYTSYQNTNAVFDFLSIVYFIYMLVYYVVLKVHKPGLK